MNEGLLSPIFVFLPVAVNSPWLLFTANLPFLVSYKLLRPYSTRIQTFCRILRQVIQFWSICEDFHPQFELARKLCSVLMVFLFTCLIVLIAVFWTKLLILTSKKVVYFCLPFSGSHSLQIRSHTNRLCKLLFSIWTLDLSFAHQFASRPSFPFVKGKVPKFLKFKNLGSQGTKDLGGQRLCR